MRSDRIWTGVLTFSRPRREAFFFFPLQHLKSQMIHFAPVWWYAASRGRICGSLSSSFAADEIHFNLMAIVSDRRMIYEKEIAELEKRKEQAAQRVSWAMIECKRMPQWSEIRIITFRIMSRVERLWYWIMWPHIHVQSPNSLIPRLLLGRNLGTRLIPDPQSCVAPRLFSQVLDRSYLFPFFLCVSDTGIAWWGWAHGRGWRRRRPPI